MTERSEALGKDGNRRWDDKSDHDDVTKIYVNYSLMGIESIRFDYVKSGKPIEGPFRGETYNTYTHTFEINHLKNEHLESVEGSYTQRGIQTLQFKTNLRISEPIGYPGKDGIKFILAVEGKKNHWVSRINLFQAVLSRSIFHSGYSYKNRSDRGQGRHKVG
jgi:hypothetical protein